MNAEADLPEGKGILVSEDPFADFNRLTRHFTPAIPPSASVDPTASIGAGTHLAPNVVIGANVKIGQDCVIQSGVVIHQHSEIGDRVIIHANTVIGADAFYYQKRDNGFNKMHTCGSVVIEDDVEIGALCTIDRGVTADTRIGQGSKLDNQVHIGHDTVVGKHCLFAAQVGIAGCVTVEDHVTLWGQVGVPSDLTIGERAVVLGQSGLTKTVEGGKTYFGSPAEEASKKFRELAALRRILRDR
jgi:UDP-3-O-[3-hydroxymyristoyl] glucosamine N-acyltransferase